MSGLAMSERERLRRRGSWRIGAPLGHDFCTISLSDLLTPWEHIQRRVKAAGEGDFVIAFYNPVSMKRRTQLAYARDELLKYRPATTPVILATNLGREGENVRTVPLGELNVDDVDMLTVVVVGSSESRTVTTGDGHWGRVRSLAQSSGMGGTPLNVDARPEMQSDGRVLLALTLEYGDKRVSQQDMPKPPEGVTMVGVPQRNITDVVMNQSVTVLLESGKPLVITQAADPVSDRKVTVEVKATVLK